MALAKRKVLVRSKPTTTTVKPKPGKPKLATSKPKKRTSGFATGMDGFERAKEIKQEQDVRFEKKRATPFDFRLKPGENADLCLLDDKPFFVRLHNWQTGPKRWETEVCIADTGENCPLCSFLNKEGSYTLVMSAVDRRSYKDRAGKLVKVSKKLVKAKTKNIPKFERLFKRHKTLRGLVINFARDTSTEASIGESIEYTNKKVPEAKLEALKEIGQPADYETIFEMPSAAELRERHNLDAPIGSADFGKKSSAEEEPDDSDPWD